MKRLIVCFSIGVLLTALSVVADASALNKGFVAAGNRLSIQLPIISSASHEENTPVSSTNAYTLYLPLLTKSSTGLAWPIGCRPGVSCQEIGYPDVDGDGVAFNCGQPGYSGHEGTDIRISWAQMDSGIPVFAAADGQVLWVFDGRYDRCPSSHPDCQPSGYTVCTEAGYYCGTGTCCCYWCFAGGNVVVIRHLHTQGVFATRYDHLRTHSITVSPNQFVRKGQKIAEVGSAGASTAPHLHFEVWGTGYYEPADPWAGPCGPNTNDSLWDRNPPWGGANDAP